MTIEEHIPLPSEEYMRLVCGTDCPNLVGAFRTVGAGMAEMLHHHGMIEPGTDFLDVGCGCGRMARYLISSGLRSYIGFDRHPGMIEWCRTHIGAVAPHFTFQFFDLKSAYVAWDSHPGSITPSSFCFPFPDASFDSALLASVFTHMPLEESVHYLRELHRVLKPAGRGLLSVFFSDEEARSEDINYLYPPAAFHRAMRRAGFLYTGLNTSYSGTRHNWYLLRPRRSGLRLFGR